MFYTSLSVCPFSYLSFILLLHFLLSIFLNFSLYWTFSYILLYIVHSSLYHKVSFLLDHICPFLFIKWSFFSFLFRDIHIGVSSGDVTFLLYFLWFAVLLLQRFSVHTQPPFPLTSFRPYIITFSPPGSYSMFFYISYRSVRISLINSTFLFSQVAILSSWRIASSSISNSSLTFLLDKGIQASVMSVVLLSVPRPLYTFSFPTANNTNMAWLR